MMTNPAILFPVIAFVFAVVFGRIITMLLDAFIRKDEVYMDVATSEHVTSAESEAEQAALRR
jgi:hypothetical protein